MIRPGQNGDEAAFVSGLNEAFFNAGGVQFIQFRALVTGVSIESPICQIQNQADILYYSGHGSHSGKYVTYGAIDRFYATDAETAWKTTRYGYRDYCGLFCA